MNNTVNSFYWEFLDWIVLSVLRFSSPLSSFHLLSSFLLQFSFHYFLLKVTLVHLRHHFHLHLRHHTALHLHLEAQTVVILASSLPPNLAAKYKNHAAVLFTKRIIFIVHISVVYFQYFNKTLTSLANSSSGGSCNFFFIFSISFSFIIST